MEHEVSAMTTDEQAVERFSDEQIDRIYDALPKHPDWGSRANAPYYSRTAIRIIGNAAIAALPHQPVGVEELRKIRELVADAIDRETVGAVLALDAIDDIAADMLERITRGR